MSRYYQQKIGIATSWVGARSGWHVEENFLDGLQDEEDLLDEVDLGANDYLLLRPIDDGHPQLERDGRIGIARLAALQHLEVLLQCCDFVELVANVLEHLQVVAEDVALVEKVGRPRQQDPLIHRRGARLLIDFTLLVKEALLAHGSQEADHNLADLVFL